MRFGTTVGLGLAALLAAYLARDAAAPYLPPILAGVTGAGAGGAAEGAAGAKPAAAAAVLVVQARAGSLPLQRQTIGRIVPVAQTDASSPVAGIVREVAVRDGMAVRAGDMLVRLDDRAIRATIERDSAVVAKGQSALDDANAKLERLQKLIASGAQSAQAGEDQRAVVRAAEATLGADKAQLLVDQVALSLTEIRAPFDGMLGAVLVSPGAFVGAGENVVSITRLSPVFAEFSLPESDLALARNSFAQGALSVSLRPVLADSDAARATGPVVFLDASVDPSSATFRLRARLENADAALWPGQSVDVLIDAGTTGPLVLVSAVAVVPRASGPVVHVVGADGRVTIRRVTVALISGQVAGLSEGVKPGEQVVTEGQINLADGDMVIASPAPDSAAAAAAANP